ncbi:unnamed protein product, partial [Laminaria digitata]
MPMSGLHGQCSMTDGGVETWIADNGASQHMTYNPEYLYNRRSPSPENAQVYIGDGTILQVEYVGSVDLTFHSSGQDVRETLESVSFLPQLRVNLLSLHTIQVKEPVSLDSRG